MKFQYGLEVVIVLNDDIDIGEIDSLMFDAMQPRIYADPKRRVRLGKAFGSGFFFATRERDISVAYAVPAQVTSTINRVRGICRRRGIKVKCRRFEA